MARCQHTIFDVGLGRLRRGLVLALVVLLGAACGRTADHASPPEPDGLARPPFVRVETETGPTLFLLGTIHLGPPDGWRFSPEIERVVAEADTLVLEIDVAGLDADEVATATAERVILQGGRRLPDVLSPETNAVLEARDAELSEIGLTARARSLYEPWFLFVGLGELSAQRSDLSLSKSVESALLERFGGDEMLALETYVEQLDMLDGLPLPLQDLMLRDALSRLDEADAELALLVEAWREADRATLLDQARAGVDELPELEAVYTLLLDDRNERWLVPLEAIARDPARKGQTVLVAVGALHVVGDVGVPALLRKAGYTVNRIH
ncbi:MAG: TraB/GumN family protein [bacterium]|nr:TraB/GumN family protein [bacterium]